MPPSEFRFTKHVPCHYDKRQQCMYCSSKNHVRGPGMGVQNVGFHCVSLNVVLHITPGSSMINVWWDRWVDRPGKGKYWQGNGVGEMLDPRGGRQWDGALCVQKNLENKKECSIHSYM